MCIDFLAAFVVSIVSVSELLFLLSYLHIAVFKASCPLHKVAQSPQPGYKEMRMDGGRGQENIYVAQENGKLTLSGIFCCRQFGSNDKI